MGPSIATTGAYPKFLKSAFASTSCLPLLNSNGFNKTCSQTGNPLPDIGTSVFSLDIGTSVFSLDIDKPVVSPDLDKPVGSPNTLKSKPCLEVTIAQKMPCIFTNSQGVKDIGELQLRFPESVRAGSIELGDKGRTETFANVLANHPFQNQLSFNKVYTNILNNLYTNLRVAGAVSTDLFGPSFSPYEIGYRVSYPTRVANLSVFGQISLVSANFFEEGNFRNQVIPDEPMVGASYNLLGISKSLQGYKGPFFC